MASPYARGLEVVVDGELKYSSGWMLPNSTWVVCILPAEASGEPQPHAAVGDSPPDLTPLSVRKTRSKSMTATYDERLNQSRKISAELVADTAILDKGQDWPK